MSLTYDWAAMRYEVLPTPIELTKVSTILGTKVMFERRIEGGQSATTDVLVTSDGHRFALRRHGRWSLGFDAGIAAREEAVIRAVGRSGVPVPGVAWSGQLGKTTAIVTDYVEGAAVITPHDPIRWASQLADTLAAIHAVEVVPSLATLFRSAPPSPVDLDPPETLLAHRRGEVLLARRRELCPGERVATNLVHGDYWPGNLLWRQDEVVAVLDWEAATEGDPVGDVGYCFAEMRFFGLDGAAEHFIAEYAKLTGSTLATLPYWIVTALCRAVPELDSYLAGWSPLGFTPESNAVRDRLERLIEEALLL